MFYIFFKHKKEIISALDERRKNFEEFDCQNISCEKEFLHIFSDDESEWVNSYDAFVCGSDQIWNPNYPTSSRLAFLQFAKKEKRIAFSPSFGITDTSLFSDEQKNFIKEIPALSVREKEAVKMVEEMTGRTPELLLDPTMLMPIEKWEALCETSSEALPKSYALIYFLGNKEKEYEKYIKSQLKEKGLERVELLNSEYPKYFSFAPNDMINAVKNADVVYTDSFHGAVFSILFKKKFVVFERQEEGPSMNSRLSTLLKRFSLSDRMYKKDFAESEIDFEFVCQELGKERLASREFLKNAMEEKYEISVIPTSKQ